MTDLPRPPLIKLFGWQFLIVIIVAMVVQLIGANRVDLYSLILGALTAILPNLFFALRVFRYRGAQLAKAVTQSFYRAETSKFIVTVIMFAAIFAAIRPINGLVVLISYGITLAIHVGLAVYYR